MSAPCRPTLVYGCVLAASLLAQATPAFSQVDLSGAWGAIYHEDRWERSDGGPLGLALGEYQGLPINDAARRRAESWSASLMTVPELQCTPHPADYAPNFSSVRIWKDVNPVTNATVAYRTEFAWMTPRRVIWMDGRPHPPAYAAHTWQGFSTGKWDGDTLTITTTHLKPGYLRRVGVARSEKATLLEHLIRNDNVLTWVSIVVDPVYLTEPFIRSRNFVLDLGLEFPPEVCYPNVEIMRDENVIPHYLPGTNPYLQEFAIKHHLPVEATRGGAETMYPEYMTKLRTLPSASAARPEGTAAATPAPGARSPR